MTKNLVDVSGAMLGRSRRHRIVLALLGIWLVTAASGCGLIQQFGKHSTTTDKLQNQKVLHLDQFVVNLADPTSDAFLRVGIDIGVQSDSPAITANGPDPAVVGLVRDTILKIITTRTSGDLLTPEGKDALKAMILAAIQKRDPSMGATAIYFTDFLVQR